jgi:hypothetical protein
VTRYRHRVTRIKNKEGSFRISSFHTFTASDYKRQHTTNIMKVARSIALCLAACMAPLAVATPPVTAENDRVFRNLNSPKSHTSFKSGRVLRNLKESSKSSESSGNGIKSSKSVRRRLGTRLCKGSDRRCPNQLLNLFFS